MQKGNTDLPAKYNSQELDKETNFYFYNARYYDPAIARFASADTVVDGEYDTQGWNRFSYVKGNPIRYRDPTGHWSLDDVIDNVQGAGRWLKAQLSLTQATYSEAGKDKKALDEQVANEGISIDSDSGDYWRAYIDKASKGKVTVTRNAQGMQFFIIKDGWEGFLPKGKVTSKNGATEVTRDFSNGNDVKFYNRLGGEDKKGAVESFDANDALVVFDSKGNLVGASQLLISNVHKNEGKNDFEDGKNWNGKEAYRSNPKNPLYTYLGISVRDGDRFHSDVHGPMGSRGCIQASPLDRDGNSGNSAWIDIERAIRKFDKGETMGKMEIIGY